MRSSHRPRFGFALAALGLWTLAGCGPSPQRAPAPEITFAEHVAPILFDHCAPCHSPGGSAPFNLLEYEDVRSRARLIAEVTGSRVMPPWLPEPGSPALVGERRLDPTQIDLIRRWVDQGAAPGAGADLPPRPGATEGWRLGEPDLIVKLPEAFTLRADGPDVWRNFVLDLPIARTRFVKTIELRPGSARVVHHAVLAIDDRRSSRRRDAQDDEIGFEGMDMGDADMPDGALLGWTPGMQPFPGVEGSAWRLQPGSDAVLQLHMVPSGKPERIEPAIGFHFANEPGIGLPMYVLQLDADDQLDIPPGAAAFPVTDALDLPVDVEILAVYPHAHYLGRRVEAWATLPDGTTRWLLRIEQWDFKWQDVYRFTEPLALPRGARVHMRWTYDNSSDNPRQTSHPPTRVVAGDRSSDEMAHVLLQMRLRREQDLPVLKEAHLRHLVRRNPRNARFLYGLAGALKDQGRFADAASQYRAALASDPAHVSARINLGAVLIAQGLTDAGIRQLRVAVGEDRDSVGAHYNLGFALASQGQLDLAIHHYREALGRRPQFAEAHNNLGQLLTVRGDLDQALIHLREAVRLLPDSAEVHNNLGIGLLRSGMRAEAIAAFQRALAIDPGHPGARQNLEEAGRAGANPTGGATR